MTRKWKNSEWGYRGTTTAGVICEICRWRKSRDGFSCNSQLYPLGHIVYMQLHRKMLRPGQSNIQALIFECPCCGAAEWVNRSRKYRPADVIIDKLWATSQAFSRKMAAKIQVTPYVYNPELDDLVRVDRQPKREPLPAYKREQFRQDTSLQKKIREQTSIDQQAYMAMMRNMRRI